MTVIRYDKDKDCFVSAAREQRERDEAEKRAWAETAARLQREEEEARQRYLEQESRRGRRR